MRNQLESLTEKRRQHIADKEERVPVAQPDGGRRRAAKRVSNNMEKIASAIVPDDRNISSNLKNQIAEMVRRYSLSDQEARELQKIV